MKNLILSTALESLESSVPEALQNAGSDTQQIATAPTGTKEVEPKVAAEVERLSKDKLVMNAPLSTLFTRALNIALAKKDPATGDFEGQKPAMVTEKEALAVESQAQDSYFFAANRKIIQDALMEARPGDPTEPKQSEVPEELETSGSGTRLVAPATHEELIKFVNNDALDLDPQFVFVTKVGTQTDGVPRNSWDQQDMILLNDKAGQGYVVESIEIVVHTRKLEQTE